MSYPMNEFVTDLEKSEQTAENRISSEAGDVMSSAIKRGRSLYKALGRRAGKDVHAVNAAVHENPYPTMLAGVGAGAVIGYLVACRLNGRCG